MFINLLKSIVRSAWKNRSYSLLNIFGLAIGIACSGLIFLWMESELGYDSSYSKKDLIYSVRTNQTYDGKTRTFMSSPGPLAPAIAAGIPGITNACRFANGGNPLFSYGDKDINVQGAYVDSTMFAIFTPTFVEGNAKDAFSQLYSIVITEKMAKRFFGRETNLIGRTLRQDNKQDFVVTGVIRDNPENSTLQQQWFAPFAIFRKTNGWLQYWGANGVQTYVTLDPAANPAAIGQQLSGFIAKKSGDAGAAKPILFAMTDWRLRDHFEDGRHLPGGRITYINLFSVIAWIILLIACINFMNLATARSEKRAREVGVRKVLGAGRNALTLQFIGEAIGMALIAVIAGIALIRLALPAFNLLVEKQLHIDLDQPRHILYVTGIGILCGLVAGSYPALYLSAFNPVFVLKGIRTRDGSAGLIRKGLVVLQFTVSIVLIISTIIIYQQVQHVKGRELGYNRDNLVKVDIQGNLLAHYAAVRQDLLNTGLVENVATSDNEILYTSNNSTDYSWQGKDPNRAILISYRKISPDFIATWGMHVEEGRGFNPDIPTDSNHVIITRSFASLMGKGPAIGRTIVNGDKSYLVIGVIGDLVYGDMYGSGDPIIFNSTQEYASRMYIRLKPNSRPEDALAGITAVMKKDNPGYPFNYRFVDDQFNELFKSESLIGRLSRIFAGLAILISCFGLFGLSAYTAERRTREIGIRKVLGATVPGITRQLSKDFVLLVAVSALIAFPLAWWSMHSWLQGYAYRVDIHWWVFAAAGLAALVIALATTSIHAIRTAMINPTKSLRQS